MPWASTESRQSAFKGDQWGQAQTLKLIMEVKPLILGRRVSEKMLRAGSKSLQSCFLTAGAPVSSGYFTAENLDMIGTRGTQRLKGRSGNDPLGPMGPSNKTNL